MHFEPDRVGEPPRHTWREAFREWLARLFGQSRERLSPQAPPPDPAALFVQLSPRERQVAVLAAEGWSNKEIAEDLSISLDTVKMHMRRVLEKMRFKSRTDLRVFYEKYRRQDAQEREV